MPSKYIFCLDAGHGYKKSKWGRSSSGASGYGLPEDDFALDMVDRIGHHIRAEGHRTIITRPDSLFVTLIHRVDLALRGHANVFCSIHANSASDRHAAGWEAYVAKDDIWSRRAAAYLLSHVEGHDRGVKWDSQSQHKSLAVLRGTYKSMLAILLECGFLSNTADLTLMKDKFWRERVAKQISAALIDIAAGKHKIVG